MKRLYLFVVFLLVACRIFGQTTVSGVVTNTEGKPLAGLSVTVREKDSDSMLTYFLTDNKGAFRLLVESRADSLTVSVSGLSVERQSRTVANRASDLAFVMATRVIRLNEVKISPPKITKLNDTLNYHVESFAGKSDRTIGDVLKKMPGIEVKDDGSILYNNRPINKFYIEDKDMLQGKYGLATNNIEFKDVSTVQVLENHQPVKALKDREFSEDAAINLKLKEAAKGVLVANAKLGAGLGPLLWNNELFTMYFNSKRQNINTYKGNNSGNDATAELNSLYTGTSFNSNNGIALAVQSPGSPGISPARYLFNRAHAFSVNNLWADKRSRQLIANLSYLTDRQEKNSFSRSEYYLPADSVLTITEVLNSAATVHQADVSLQYNANETHAYVDNLLRFSGRWNRSDGLAFNPGTISQQLDEPFFQLSNDFKLVRNAGKRSFNLSSNTAFSRSPQELLVSPVQLGSIAGSDAMRQDLDHTKLISSNKISYSRGKGTWRQQYSAGLNAEVQRVNSDLYTISSQVASPLLNDSLRNRLRWNRYEMYATPDYTYQHKRFRATLSFPLVWQLLFIDGQRNRAATHSNRLFFNPQANLRYELSSFVNITASAAYSRKTGGVENAYTSYILQSYRSLTSNDGQQPLLRNQSYSAEVNYRNPLKSIFAHLGARYNRNGSNLLYGYEYLGYLSLRRTYDMPVLAKNYSLSGRISKSIDLLSAVLSLGVDYRQSSGTQISQQHPLDFSNRRMGISPGLSAKLGGFASVDWQLRLDRTRTQVEENDNDHFPVINTTIQRTQLNFFPRKGLAVNLVHEYFYTSSIARGNRTMSFADAGIKYKFGKMEIAAAYANIFDTRQYFSASYTDISSYYYAYDLRPAQFLVTVRFKVH